MSDQIVRERALLWNVAHEHGDGASDRLIEKNNEDLVGVADKNGASPARRQNRTNLHLDHRLVHWAERYPSPRERQARCRQSARENLVAAAVLSGRIGTRADGFLPPETAAATTPQKN